MVSPIASGFSMPAPSIMYMRITGASDR